MNAGAQAHLLLIARILVASLFLVAGVRKLLGFSLAAGYFAKLGFPMPEVMTGVAILIEIGAGALLVAGWQTRRAAWLLILFTAIATAMGHRFWEFEPALRVNQMNHFLKNVAIVGGLLYLVAFGPGALSADQRGSAPK